MSLTERRLHAVTQARACGVDNAQLFQIRAGDWVWGKLAGGGHATHLSLDKSQLEVELFKKCR